MEDLRGRTPARGAATATHHDARATPGGSRGRIPDFFLVGHSKSGTTALYQMLAQHPQVFVGTKEPRYFAVELHERDIPRPEGTPKTLEQYMAWFAGAAPEPSRPGERNSLANFFVAPAIVYCSS